MKKPKDKYLLLKVIISLGILISLFFKIGIQNIIDSLSQSDYIIILIAFVPYLFALLVKVINFKILLYPIKNIGLRLLSKYYLLGWSLSSITPGRLGDISLVYFLKEKVPMGAGASAIFIDKSMTLLVTFIVSVVGIALLIDFYSAMNLLVVVIILLIAILVLLSNKVRSIIKRFLGEKSKIFKGFHKTLVQYIKRYKRFLIINVMLTLFIFFLQSYTNKLLFLSLGSNVPMFLIFTILCIETIVSAIPISINGLGVRESAGVALYSLFGINPIITMSVYIVGIALRYAIVLILLLFIKR